MTSAELKYLITIKDLYDGTAGVKLTAIAVKMNVTKVSAYRAAERLERDGCIKRDEKNKVVMTEYGYEQLKKYDAIIEWLYNNLRENCKISAETAFQDAVGAACAFSEESRVAVTEFVMSRKKEDNK